MTVPDGDVLVTLHLPMPVRTVAAVCAALYDAATALGYTDVVLLTDGTNRVVARRAGAGEPAGPPAPTGATITP